MASDSFYPDGLPDFVEKAIEDAVSEAAAMMSDLSVSSDLARGRFLAINELRESLKAMAENDKYEREKRRKELLNGQPS